MSTSSTIPPRFGLIKRPPTVASLQRYHSVLTLCASTLRLCLNNKKYYGSSLPFFLKAIQCVYHVVSHNSIIYVYTVNPKVYSIN